MDIRYNKFSGFKQDPETGIPFLQAFCSLFPDTTIFIINFRPKEMTVCVVLSCSLNIPQQGYFHVCTFVSGPILRVLGINITVFTKEGGAIFPFR